MNIQALGLLSVTGKDVAGNSPLLTPKPDIIALEHMPRLYQTQVDYTAVTNTAGAKGPKFYLSDPRGQSANLAIASQNAAYVQYKAFKASNLVRLIFNGMPLKMGNTTGNCFGTIPLLTHPLGRVLIIGGTDNLVFDFTSPIWSTAIINNGTVAGNFSFGSTGTTDATLSTTDVDAMASTAFQTVATGASPVAFTTASGVAVAAGGTCPAGVSRAYGNFVKSTEFDGTTTTTTSAPLTLNLNAIVTTGSTDAQKQIVYVWGSLLLRTDWLGDY